MPTWNVLGRPYIFIMLHFVMSLHICVYQRIFVKAYFVLKELHDMFLVLILNIPPKEEIQIYIVCSETRLFFFLSKNCMSTHEERWFGDC